MKLTNMVLEQLKDTKSVNTQDTSNVDKKLLNVLFIGDGDTESPNSYAAVILQTGLVTGDIVSTQGDITKLFSLLQSSLNESYDVVSFMFSNSTPDLKADTIDLLNVMFSRIKNLDLKLITISSPTKEFAPYGYVKYANTEKIAEWMATESYADYNINAYELTNNPEFFSKNKILLNKVGQLAIAKKWLAYLVKLQPKSFDDIKKKIADIGLDDTLNNKTFTIGDKSPKIMELQRRLRSLEYKIDTNESDTGEFGKSTFTAVKMFQLINELPVTGKLDTSTVNNILSSEAKSFSKWGSLFAMAPEFIKKLVLGTRDTDTSSTSAGSSVSLGTSNEVPQNLPSYKHISGGSTINRKAFLDAIAYAEGTERYPNNGYYTLFTGKQFDSLASHPNISICAPIKGKKTCSTAAGRYQFLSSTWKRLGLSDFSKTNQDKGALMLLKPKLLAAVDSGDWPTVFTGANRIWASFPGDAYGQGGKSMDQMLKFIETRIKELGGTVGDTSSSTGKNGKLSNSELVSIGPGHRLSPKAAATFLEMEKAAKEDGVTFDVSDSYRTFEIQNDKFDWERYRESGERKKRGTNIAMALPGTSNHGWGNAIDVFPKKAQDWIKQNGEKYGWSWAEGRSVGEDWHFTYVG